MIIIVTAVTIIKLNNANTIALFTRHKLTFVKTNPGCVYTTLFQTNPGRTKVSSVYTTETNPGRTKVSSVYTTETNPG